MSNFARLILLIIFICLLSLLISACTSTQEQVVPKKPCEMENTFKPGAIAWSVTTYTREQRCEGYVLSIESSSTKYRISHECQEVIANLQTGPATYSIGLVACGAYTSGTACTITVQTPKGTQVIETRIGTMNHVTL
jgi:hypothetical protein